MTTFVLWVQMTCASLLHLSADPDFRQTAREMHAECLVTGASKDFKWESHDTFTSLDDCKKAEQALRETNKGNRTKCLPHTVRP
jgi:hypothetical protein